ncbi:MAG: hypothetical protein JJLCMIEE_00686 [Acidimicrobiales bacterium]|nr:hypothetical protein [Acidimicrobiales bacterium]
MPRKDEEEIPETRQIPLRLPTAQYDAIKALAYVSGQSMNSIICRAVGEFLEDSGDLQLFSDAVEKVRTENRGLLDKLAAS